MQTHSYTYSAIAAAGTVWSRSHDVTGAYPAAQAHVLSRSYQSDAWGHTLTLRTKRLQLCFGASLVSAGATVRSRFRKPISVQKPCFHNHLTRSS